MNSDISELVCGVSYDALRGLGIKCKLETCPYWTKICPLWTHFGSAPKTGKAQQQFGTKK